MAKKALDRRVQRTRQLLQDAIVALIQEKGYEAVTVQDIIDRANLGRATFYAHFHDKQDLLLSGFENVRAAFEHQQQELPAKQGQPSPTPWDLSQVWFQHAQSSRNLYKALVGKPGGDLVAVQLHQYLSALLREHLGLPATPTKGNLSQTEPAEMVIYWTISSLLALTTWWLDHDLPYTAEQINQLFRQLTQPGFETLLNKPLNSARI